MHERKWSVYGATADIQIGFFSSPSLNSARTIRRRFMATQAGPYADERLVARARGEYLEMPGLRLTPEQAKRLWGLDAETCGRVLLALVETHFLTRGLDGRYARRTEERTSTRTTASAA
jgi:hypothetical protein